MFIKYCDVFGKEFKFLIEGRRKFQTIVGGLMSFSILILSLVLGWYFGKDIYERQKPFVTQSVDLSKYPSTVNNLTDFEALIAVKAYDASENNVVIYKYIEPVYELKTTQYDNSTLKTKDSSVYYYGVACSKIFDKSYLNSPSDIKNLICPNMTLKLGGPDSLGGNYDRVYVYFKFCTAETENRYNISCATQDETRSFLLSKKIYIDLIVQDNLFDPLITGEDPHKKSFRIDTTGLDFESTKALYKTVFYNLAVVTTDDAFLFTNEKNETYVEIDSVTTYYEPPNPKYFGGKYFFKTIVTLTQKTKIYKRSYVKLPDVLASIGGLISGVMQFMELINHFYVENEFSSYLYKKVLKICIEEDEEELSENTNLKGGFIELSKCQDVSGESKRKNNNLAQSFAEELTVDNWLNKKNVSQSNAKQNSSSIIYNRKKTEDKGRTSFTAPRKPNDQIINNEIFNAILHRKRKRRPITISSTQRCYYFFCRKYIEEKNNKNPERVRLGLKLVADNLIITKSEFTEHWRLTDRLKLLEKIFLNENQCFMIRNRDSQIVSSRESYRDLDINKLDEDAFNARKIKLIEYFTELKTKNSISNHDILLLKYLNEDIRLEVEKKIGI